MSLPRPALADEPGPSLRDVARDSGIDFRFDVGSRGKHDMPEVMGGGVALLDADDDGWLDIFLCNGGPIEPGPHRADPPCRLYRNNQDGTFADITRRANAPGPSYAMGTAVGDYDGDGRDDLFVSGWRDQRLYRNLGGGRFEDTTVRAGVVSNLWGTSAAFADLDGDGDLDLYVTNYLDYDPAKAPFCTAPDGRRDFCGPEDFAAQPDRLYRNNGDGTFTDVTAPAGIDLPGGRGLGVLIADLTGDRQPDIYVANDGTSCWLFENRGALRFREVGLSAGVAVDGQGRALSGMGVALGDVDGDGRSDLLVTNFLGRATVAFQAQGAGTYRDSSAALGLVAGTRDRLGFGLCLQDWDGDGLPDLLQVNGHVLDRVRLGVPFAMKSTFLRNENGRLIEGSAGAWFERPIVGRGLALGDLDRDGRPDAVATALDAPAALLLNRSRGGRFLTLELVAKGGRTAIGARLRMTAAGNESVHDVAAGGSYLSTSDRRVFLGLGAAEVAERFEVSWPSGRRELWSGLRAGVPLRIAEGEGRAP